MSFGLLWISGGVCGQMLQHWGGGGMNHHHGR